MNEIETFVRLKYKFVPYDNLEYGTYSADCAREYPWHVMRNVTTQYFEEMNQNGIYSEEDYEIYKNISIKALCEYEQNKPE